jgi:2-polyprenyl-6-methoxyphenol hydroxylase-like FAD-dependent oxidoreductase
MFDVAIVGFGPVGSALAILLAQQGHRVIALERFPEPYARPRAVHFDHEVGRILQSLGIGKDLAIIAEPTEEYEWRSASGQLLLRFGNSGVGLSGWPASNMMHQPDLEDALSRRVNELDNVSLHRGCEVTGIDQQENGVTVSFTNADGSTRTENAKFLVGCDGANSTIRTLIKSPVHDLGFFYDWLILDLIVHDKSRTFTPQNLQICDPTRPTTVVSGGPGRRRWEFMRLPHESIEELNTEQRAWELLAPWNLSPTNATLDRHTVYTFQARWVEQWRKGRVLLAGDAAHEMPPFAGQGMCSGIRDAINLAWKLSAVLNGTADEEVLDTYQTERIEHVRALIETSMELGKIICVADPTEAAARDEFLASMAVEGQSTEIPPNPGFSDGIRQVESPLAGKLSLQGTVSHDGTVKRLDDAIGAGWRLLSLTPVTLGPSDATWFAGLGGEVVTVHSQSTPGSSVVDVNDAYAEWFAKYEVGVVLQRPDFVVFGTATNTADASQLIADLRQQLTRSAT